MKDVIEERHLFRNMVQAAAIGMVVLGVMALIILIGTWRWL